MKVYPYVPEGPEIDVIPDEDAFAATMVALREDGAPAGYKGFEEGDDLTRPHVIGIALAGLNAVIRANEIYDAIEQERGAMNAIHPCEYATMTAFKADLTVQSYYLDVDMWVDRLKVVYDVSTWAEMLEWCAANYGQEIE